MSEQAAGSVSPRSRLLTLGNLVAAIILVVGIPVAGMRFVQGLGAVTNLSDSTPWGLWIGFDVLVGVALAAGGYVTSCAVYVFGLKQYHPIVRPAVLTGFLGYVLVAIGLLFDIGRPWRLPYPFIMSTGWTSVMFEVAACVALYLTVLFLEFLPVPFEWLRWRKLRSFFIRLTIPLTILGVILSTLHQSSLGALFIIAPTRLHPLWHSPYLAIFFFVSSIIAGLSMVIFESGLSHRIFHNRLDPDEPVDHDGLTLGLTKAAALVLFAYFAMKLIGVAHGGHWDLLNTPYGHWFLVELLGFILLPCVLFTWAYRERNARLARWAAFLTVIGIVLNRLNVSIIAFNWQLPASERYIPSWMEIMVTVTLVTIGVLAFRWIVTRMPVLAEHPAYRSKSEA
jgi:Ni/Fe-hydrogenase subunit HybB-like protein